ncbi:MAG TPA: TVP38/TMEM64 family protein [Methylomirabilota bacterium]|nr:TVP38/TMEM64 family protein [Methylomirabilota bacterium]
METASVRVTAAARRSRWRIAVWLIVVVALVGVGRTLDIAALLHRMLVSVSALGAWAPVVFVLLYVAVTVVLLPAVILTLGAGAVFGLVRGFLLVSVGATLGATAAFLIGRYLARQWVARRVAESPKLRAIDEAVAREGWKIVLLTRLSPAFPFVLLNYVFGLTRVSLRHYVVASWIGMMPGIVLYAYLGSLAGDVAAAATGGRTRSVWEWALYALGLAATVVLTIYVTRLARRALDTRLAT